MMMIMILKSSSLAVS